MGKLVAVSKGILRIPHIEEFLGAPVVPAPRLFRPRDADAVLGWGRKPSGIRAETLAQRWRLPALYLEDGFLRSLYPGAENPPCALVRDWTGIYYDATLPSDLEMLLNSPTAVLEGVEADVERAKQLVIENRLGKYNHAPDVGPSDLRAGDTRRVLVVDQTAGDSSVSKGCANAETFRAMLRVALEENPLATIYVKTHPEVSLRKKAGYLSDVQDDERIVALRHAINPLSLLAHMDRVYVVTSHMGFEALLMGCVVSCFGIPWYANWGVTDDRQVCSRRTRSRTVDELFAAAYLHYSTYLNPRTNRRGTIFDVIDWLREQKENRVVRDLAAT